ETSGGSIGIRWNNWIQRDHGDSEISLYDPVDICRDALLRGNLNPWEAPVLIFFHQQDLLSVARDQENTPGLWCISWVRGHHGAPSIERLPTKESFSRCCSRKVTKKSATSVVAISSETWNSRRIASTTLIASFPCCRSSTMRAPTEFRLKITPRSTSSTTPPSGDFERRADREIVNMSVASQDDSGSSRVPRPLLCGSVRELTLRKIKGGFWHRLRIIREKCYATLRSGLYLSGN